MTTPSITVGLVLSGGGAKGAYQVGVVKALVSLGARVDAIAGASIGALNGAILASAPSLQEGVERLETLWNTLAHSPPLAPNYPAYIGLLQAASLRLHGFDLLLRLNEMAHKIGLKTPIAQNVLEKGLLSSSPLHRLMEEYFDADALARGLPLYVSIFKSSGAITDVLRFIAAESGLFDSPPSEFLHIQSLPQSQQREALLASAAIPMLFEGRSVNGSIYRDGGIGGAKTMQGNTPITPLLQAGIKTVIVTHLFDGSLWSRHDFPDATILEIRPQSPINRDGGAKDLLGFNPHKIPSWIEQGYRDTTHCVGRVIDAMSARHTLHASEANLQASEQRFEPLDHALLTAMSRIN